MARALMLVALLSGLLIGVSARAQVAPPREVELRLHSLSRGYMRPMASTVERIAALPGMESATALGFAGDVLKVRVKTALTDAQIAAALGLQLLGTAPGRLILAVDDSARARRAEARIVLLEISRALGTLPRPEWGATEKLVFGGTKELSEQFKVLGLELALAEGAFYKPADYRIEESSGAYATVYKIWAGGEWAPTVTAREWYMDDDEGETAQLGKPANPRFVGLHLHRTPWSESASWVDAEGVTLDTVGVDRSQTDSDGKLVVQSGAERVQTLAALAAAHRLRAPDQPVRDLPSGRGNSLMRHVGQEGFDRWDPHYPTHCLGLAWSIRESDRHLIARVIAHHAGHPLYLDAEVDCDAVIANYRAQGLDTKDVRKAELGDALVWVVGAESGPEVFEQRRAEAKEILNTILAALRKLPADARAAFSGALDDAQAAALGLDFTGRYFKPADYTVTPQALGDVEIAVGTPATGGRWWLLGNAATGQAVRRFQ